MHTTTPLTTLIASITLCILSAIAPADEPQWFAVDAETAPVRCGDQEIYYTIAEFTKGTIVGVDGTSGEYSKVRYPATLGVFVSADQVRTVKANSRVQLLEESTLNAPSMLRGMDGSWCPVYAEPLEVETEMMLLEVIYDEDTNEVRGYRVAPPRPPVVESYPYAYIRTDSLRPATKEEIKKHQGGKQITIGRPSLMPAPGRDAPKTGDDSTTTNTPVAEDETKEPVIDLREDMVLPPQGGQGGEQQPVESEAADPEPVEIENTIPAVNPKPVISPEKTTRHSNGTITAASLESLERSFTDARMMPREKLDKALPELLAEFTRTRNALGDNAEETRAIDQRIEWINIRIKTRDQRRAIAQALATADERSLELGQKMDQWNDSRVYDLVGRLMLSGVYTGEHLPLMYRVRAPDPITGLDRTIGYIAPNEGQDFRRHLGTIVGIIGTPVHDDMLALTVLSPTRIDTMPNQ